jgi:hypothetical protein
MMLDLNSYSWAFTTQDFFFEFEIATVKLKGISHHILIQAGGETLHFDIHKFLNSIWDKQELPSYYCIYL